MNTPNKMMIAVGAIALTATTLLAGCGGGSTEDVPAAESTPAASSPAVESAAAEVPAPESAAVESAASDATVTLTDGLVRPADVSDENWASFTEVYEKSNPLADLTPEQLASACEVEPGEATSGDAARAEETAQELGGSVEEWMGVYSALGDNIILIACTMVE
jgi:hypothetical protein